MHINLIYDDAMDLGLQYRYSKYVYNRVLQEVRDLIAKKSQNYAIREPYILDLVPWIHKPSKIDLKSYVCNSLRLHKPRDCYVIDLNPNLRVRGSNMQVSQLVRLLEYGTLELKELPVIRRVLYKYSQIYNTLSEEYVMEVLHERISI